MPVHKKTNHDSGPGRKPMAPELKKKATTVKLSPWVLKWLNEQEEAKAVLIEQAVIQRYKLKAPKA